MFWFFVSFCAQKNNSMNDEIKYLKPDTIWKNFYQLTQIPRPSKHEDRIQAFMLDFGQKLGLRTEKDEAGNIYIFKPATKGKEHLKTVVLQAHLDMVPQKNNGIEHDFEKDPIQTYVEDGWVRARGTTLGADNGMGAAAAMAVLEATDIAHGPIEALFTSDEETGMYGAMNLRPNVLQADILLNMDSEDEGELYVGCAGGIDGEAEYSYEMENCPDDYLGFELHIKGLGGGHSGMDIHKGKGNANKLLFRFLKIVQGLDIRLSEASGGSLRNAIPREGSAFVAVPQKNRESFLKAAATYNETIRREYKTVEPNLEATTNEVGVPKKVIVKTDATKIINAVLACPNGVTRMSADMEGLTETSNNLARVEVQNGQFLVQCLMRSSSETAKEALVDEFKAVFELMGARTVTFGSYPGWQPDMDSEILNIMQSVYAEKYGKTPKIMAVHAGLECGLLGAVYPNWDMISFGPTIRNPHSPDERVHIESVAKFWDFLVATLHQIPVK